MTLHCVADLADLSEGEMVQVGTPSGVRVALYNVAGTIFATEDRCTHGNSSLADEGYLEGHVIECGRHGGAFDVRTGAAIRTPCTVAVKSFPVVIQDGRICVDLDVAEREAGQ